MLTQREEKTPASPASVTMEESAPTKIKYDRWIAKWPQRGAACGDECKDQQYDDIYGFPAKSMYDPPLIDSNSRAYQWGRAAMKATCLPLMACHKLGYAAEYLAEPI